MPDCSNPRADIEAPVFHADAAAIRVVRDLRGRICQDVALVIVVSAERRIPAFVIFVAHPEQPAELIRRRR